VRVPLCGDRVSYNWLELLIREHSQIRRELLNAGCWLVLLPKSNLVLQLPCKWSRSSVADGQMTAARDRVAGCDGSCRLMCAGEVGTRTVSVRARQLLLGASSSLVSGSVPEKRCWCCN